MLAEFSSSIKVSNSVSPCTNIEQETARSAIVLRVV